MAQLTKSISAYEEDVRCANRAATLEMLAIGLFLVGLVFVILALVFPVGFFVEQMAPEQAAPAPQLMILPASMFGPWATLLGVLPFLVPAGVLMSAGLVLRRFLEKA
jgi:hypothetical protein